jgi:hypothetical protein
MFIFVCDFNEKMVEGLNVFVVFLIYCKLWKVK